MKKKIKPIKIVIIVLLILLLFPIPFRLKDGGSVEYRSIVGIYEVRNWKQMGFIENAGETLKTGITVKVFGIKVFDNTKTEFHKVPEEKQEEQNTDAPTITPGPLDAIDTLNFPTTMSADEMLQKAIDEDFVVLYEFEYLNGEDKWQEFYETTRSGTPAAIYLAKYYTLDEVGVSEEYYEANKEEYPKIFLLSLSFDGEKYIIADRPGTMEGVEMVRSYPYLLKLEGKPRSATALFDRYEYYVLVHDESLTWSKIEHGMFSSQLGDQIDHYSAVQKHIMEEETR